MSLTETESAGAVRDTGDGHTARDERRDRPGAATRVLRMALRGVLPIIVVLAGILGAAKLIQTAPKARQRPPQVSATLVSVREVQPDAEQVVVRAMGTVIAAREVVLQPQVSGTIEAVHPALVPGGRVSAGEVLAEVDAADYEVAVHQAEASLARARAQLRSAELEVKRLERLRTQQAVNKKEMDDALTALAVAQADVQAAEAALEKARLDRERTTIRAPFTCVVTTENVDVGSQVTPQTQLATLVGVDEYWVRATVPVAQLGWIEIPNEASAAGSPVRVRQRLGPGRHAEWRGHVERLLGDLEPQGRMARLLVTVPDPFGAERDASQPPLLIGSYVEVEIQGRSVANVVALQRAELREGDAVWVLDGEHSLEIRPVEVLYRGREQVFIRGGLSAGERVVTSDLTAPVPGMPLRTSERREAPASAGSHATTTRAAEGHR